MKKVELSLMVLALGLNALAVEMFQKSALAVPALPLFIFSLIVVSWVIGRSSEVVVEGLDEVARVLGFPSYSLGVVSSLASTLPELTMTLMAVASGTVEMVEVAVLASLSSVGLGILLL
ncbi:MAG TPA: hypothetical protein ENG61_01325, partial [Candidatus Korarchaeota archaeon]|nr:hypothetical protein [Candidatus Korarchaeota archaeon]